MRVRKEDGTAVIGVKDYNPRSPMNEDYGRFTRIEIRESEEKSKCQSCNQKVRGSGKATYDSDLDEC